MSKHQRKSEHDTDELGKCTCSAKRPGTRAEENSPLAVIIFVRRQLRWDSTNKVIDEYLDTELGID